ncbi:MAG: ABC transporter substrate-binding protein [Thermodesulfobacteriota bacterium]
MRRKPGGWLLVLVLCGALVPAGAWAAEKILIGMSNWIGYAPLYLAQEKGLFKARGLDVEVKIIEKVADRRAALAAGHIQGMCTTADAHVITAANDIPVRMVLALDDSYGGDGIVASQSIKSVEDLKGKNVAGHKGGATLFWTNYVLTQHKMKLSDINMIDMTAGDAASAFVAGKVDAAITWEPHLSRAAREGKGHVLLDSRKTPGVIVDALAFRPDFIEKNPDAVAKIVQAWFEALDYHKKNPDEANAIMAKFTKDTPESYKQHIEGVRFYGLQENKAYFGTREKPGELYKVVERALDLWMETKQIPKRVEPSSVIDGSFIKQ